MAWSTIDADTSWQDLSVAQEIAAAYNARRAVCGLSSIDTPDQATAVYDFILAVQSGIETMATQFADSASALEDETGLLSYFSIDQAMTAAGLTASGYWRRIPEGGVQPSAWTSYTASGWSYGKIQSKDLAGPWLFKDIQLALSVLTRRLISESLAAATGSYCRAEKYQTWSALPLANYPPAVSGTIASSLTLQDDVFGFMVVKFAEQSVNEVEALLDASVQRGYAAVSGLGTSPHVARLLIVVSGKSAAPDFAGLLNFQAADTTAGRRYLAYAGTLGESDDESSLVLDSYEGASWSSFSSQVAWPTPADGVQRVNAEYIYFNTSAQWVIDYSFPD